MSVELQLVVDHRVAAPHRRRPRSKISEPEGEHGAGRVPRRPGCSQSPPTCAMSCVHRVEAWSRSAPARRWRRSPTTTRLPRSKPPMPSSLIAVCEVAIVSSSRGRQHALGVGAAEDGDAVGAAGGVLHDHHRRQRERGPRAGRAAVGREGRSGPCSSTAPGCSPRRRRRSARAPEWLMPKPACAYLALDRVERDRAVDLRRAGAAGRALVLVVGDVQVRDDDDADQADQHADHQLDQAHAGLALRVACV